jgi:hypothetical protein
MLSAQSLRNHVVVAPEQLALSPLWGSRHPNSLRLCWRPLAVDSSDPRSSHDPSPLSSRQRNDRSPSWGTGLALVQSKWHAQADRRMKSGAVVSSSIGLQSGPRQPGRICPPASAMPSTAVVSTHQAPKRQRKTKVLTAAADPRTWNGVKGGRSASTAGQIHGERGKGESVSAFPRLAAATEGELGTEFGSQSRSEFGGGGEERGAFGHLRHLRHLVAGGFKGFETPIFQFGSPPSHHPLGGEGKRRPVMLPSS